MPEFSEPNSTVAPASTGNVSVLKTPPHSIEAEHALLSGLMLDNSEWDNIADVLIPEDFYRNEHKLIFSMMMQQSDDNKAIDAVTLAELLNSRGELDAAGGIAYIDELTMYTRGTANIKEYAEIIRERAILRRLIIVANTIAASGYNTGGRSATEVIDEAERWVFEISDERPLGKGPEFVNPLLHRVVDRIDELAGSDSDLTGLTSGFKDLDKKTGGWQKSDLIIIAARPSMGKTAFVMNLVENALIAGKGPALVFSLEMPAESLIFRLLSSAGRIDHEILRSGKLTDEQWGKFNPTVGMLKDKPLFIDDSPGISPIEMRSRARRIQREHGPLAMIVVDYMQLMQIKGTTENRTNEISEISRSLKLLAREFECPVFALSQLNRSVDQRTDKRPVLSDLRESGAIEQDADIIAFIYREEVYDQDTEHKGIAEIIIGKHRNGPTGKVKLNFIDNLTRFEDYAPQTQYYDQSYTHGT
ncbi:MAG: replicative DNA helicase [Gammaproteobacteria bacterium]|nr:replicative DNA helicase [Gammaproteobacteria bacterium]MCY4357606.1 replicative DNA helicase [Gammaproteobacteria bacterium]